MKQFITLCSFGVIAAGAAGAAGCSHPRAAAPAADAPSVSVAKVVRTDLARTLTLAAEFLPYQEIDVHAKVAGYVKSILVDVGDRVSAGQLIAVLEIPELQDEMAQDDAAVTRSSEAINRARADLARAESAHEVAHLASTRLAGVMKQQTNLVAQQDIDEALGRDRVAEAQVATSQAALAEAQAQLAVAKANQDKTKTMFAYARITAPFAGVITHRYADTGAMIQAGTSSQTQSMPLVKLSENTTLRLIIQVPESAVSGIHVNGAVDVHVQAFDRTFTGKVARFADKIEPDTRTMETEVDVPNPKLELVPGMYASASIVLDEARGALAVPIEAVDRHDNGASVVVANSAGAIEIRDVTLGLETADRIEVRSGLSENDLVVVGNRAQLKAGEHVVPKPVDARPAEGAR
jgi:RND family efflux transporter MFP subunit